MTPRVTIGIPCWNQAQYLDDAIQSALAQTEPCEIIVCIDGSQDNSLEVAKKYEPKIKIINQVNKGLPSARNSIIMAMSGEFFLPLDADDILDPKCVGELLYKADETGADVVAPSMREFGLSSAITILDPHITIEKMRLGNHLGYFSLIRKSALLECGGYSPKMVQGWEDYHLWFDLLTRGKKIVTVQQPLVFYRTKADSMWQESRKHEKELWDQIFKDFPQILPKAIV